VFDAIIVAGTFSEIVKKQRRDYVVWATDLRACASEEAGLRMKD
jgi:hypothetical protein